MKRLLSAVLFLVSAVACSADEGANAGVRCVDDTYCSTSQVCYRGFCIRGDGPVEVDLDASQSPISELEGGPSELPDGALGSHNDGGKDSGSSLDASETVSSLDAATQPIDPPESGGPMSGPTDPPPPVDPPPTPVDPPPPPTVDAGTTPPPAVDAGNANPAQLLVCLPACSNNRNAACLFCLRSVLMENPQVCLAAEGGGGDQTVRWLCDFLCRTEDCGGRP